MADTIDWPPTRRPRRRVGLSVLALLAVLLLTGGTVLSYFVDALWFSSLGFVDVFWTTLDYQSVVFRLFFVADLRGPSTARTSRSSPRGSRSSKAARS